MSSVLIIDDETALVNSLTFALRNDGYEVEGAATGADGLRALAQHAPAVVLLDVRLPDGSGLEWLEKIRAAHPDVPVVMISAHGDTRAAVRSVKMGAFDYLTKPFELDDLLITLRAALERERMAQELSRFHGELPGARGLWGRCAPYGTTAPPCSPRASPPCTGTLKRATPWMNFCGSRSTTRPAKCRPCRISSRR